MLRSISHDHQARGSFGTRGRYIEGGQGSRCHRYGMSDVPDEPGGVPEKNIRDVQGGSEHAHPLSSSVSGAGPWPIGTGFAIGHESFHYQSVPEQITVINLQPESCMKISLNPLRLGEGRGDVTLMIDGKLEAGLY